jgi:tRNA(adenine34) deaminase
MSLDLAWMEHALAQAQKAFEANEVPVGAVVVREGRIVGRGHNQIEGLQDSTAHAEIIAMGSAANTLETWRLNECDLYVTLEPCMMCCGAILLSRIRRVVYGAADPRFGACGSQYQLLAQNKYNQAVDVVAGVLAEPSSALIKKFFQKVREKGPRHGKEESE